MLAVEVHLEVEILGAEQNRQKERGRWERQCQQYCIPLVAEGTLNLHFRCCLFCEEIIVNYPN